MYWQLANDRADLLEPTKDIAEASAVRLQALGGEVAKIGEIRDELRIIQDRLIHVANSQRLPDSESYLGRLISEINGAIESEPRQPTPVLRLMRLSGHWKLNDKLERTAQLLAKFFHPGETATKWANQWEVRILYAVADKETLDSLMNKKAILGKLQAEYPKNYTFRAISRREFEPSIGLAVVSNEVAFVAFDESTVDPFPEQGLEIRGDAVEWYVNWFDEMFESSCALKIYERGKTHHAAIEALRKSLEPSPGQS
jgi:hypothetical protein